MGSAEATSELVTSVQFVTQKKKCGNEVQSLHAAVIDLKSADNSRFFKDSLCGEVKVSKCL